MKKKARVAPRKWVTVEATVHIGRRRIARLLPIRVEPGRKFVPGAKTIVRRLPYAVKGFGYESGSPTIHLEKLG